ncbi:MAG: hypothetical protein K2W95_28275 [Candidatus Obscuribacterales bacterium]|nr:hypothetical protein [Candidatus Obscuribacterales bacterium]
MSNSGSGAVDEQETDPNKVGNESTDTGVQFVEGSESKPVAETGDNGLLSETAISGKVTASSDSETHAVADEVKSVAVEPASDARATTPADGEAAPPAGEPADGRRTFSKIHVSHILDEVLEESAETAALPEEAKKRLRYPMVIDLVLGLGLLVAMGGFTLGLFNMYLVHAATDSINKANYEAAVHLLRGAPMPQIFAVPGSDTEELMSQAIYLDSFEKTKQGRIDDAIQQLRLIKPGSKYFSGAQHLIGENTERAEVLLEGGTETLETSPPPVAKKTATEHALQSED